MTLHRRDARDAALARRPDRYGSAVPRELPLSRWAGYPNDDNDRWLEPGLQRGVPRPSPESCVGSISIAGRGRADFWAASRARASERSRTWCSSSVRRPPRASCAPSTNSRTCSPRESCEIRLNPFPTCWCWEPSGNEGHPTQNLVSVFEPLIRASRDQANSFSTRSAGLARRWLPPVNSGEPTSASS